MSNSWPSLRRKLTLLDSLASRDALMLRPSLLVKDLISEAAACAEVSSPRLALQAPMLGVPEVRSIGSLPETSFGSAIPTWPARSGSDSVYYWTKYVMPSGTLGDFAGARPCGCCASHSGAERMSRQQRSRFISICVMRMRRCERGRLAF